MNEITEVKIGNVLVNPRGVTLTVTDISISSFHLSEPRVAVTYTWDDHGRANGSETVSLSTFKSHFKS